jgi:hypothetical protein
VTDQSYLATGVPAGLSLLRNIGGGAFTGPVDYRCGSDPAGLVATDLDGDGHPDLAVASQGSSVAVMLNLGNGLFAPQVLFGCGEAPVGITSADFDGNGRFDLATADYYGNTTTILLSCTSAGSSFCFGDGSGTACPCGNASPAGSASGCRSSLGLGATLRASGTASLAHDTIVLHGSEMTNSSALYYQGTTMVNGGAGSMFGDGLRCAGGAIVRLGVRINVGGESMFPAPGGISVSVRGGVAGPGSRSYQVWYRNAAPFCMPSTFNLTNGLSIAWQP